MGHWGLEDYSPLTPLYNEHPLFCGLQICTLFKKKTFYSGEGGGGGGGGMLDNLAISAYQIQPPTSQNIISLATVGLNVLLIGLITAGVQNICIY